MVIKVFVSLSALLFVLINPYIEIGTTHLFNNSWSGHARLHNAWQLISNTGFSIFSIWLLWYRGLDRVAAVVSILISSSFLIAYFLSHLYGGTLKYVDGSEFNIFGFNPTITLLIIINLGLFYGLFKPLNQKGPSI